jgi:Mg-chelatase subunit ChlD
MGTVTFTVLADTGSNGTTVSFGPNSQALALSTDTTSNENVLANRGTILVRASGQAPTQVCSTVASDTMVVIDKSGSMNDRITGTTTKIAAAKSAATNFINILAAETKNTLGFVSFETTATLNNTLTTDYNAVKTQINNISANGDTCIQCAILKANQEIASHGRSNAKKVVVLLTDGIANRIEGGSGKVSQTTAEQKAIEAAQAGKTANGTVFFTIGLGNDINSTFLKKLATDTGGQYYASPTTDQLNSIYQQISQVLAKGSISGTVFNDANNNHAFDTGEQTLSGWILQLFAGSSSIPQNITTDSTGTFTITGLCDGTFTLKEIQQPGWTQTIPAAANGYTINITNGSAVGNQNFGNYLAPTPTPTNTPTPTPKPRCADGIDNDNNGVADSKDSTCHTDGNPGNPNSYDPNKDGEHGGNTCADAKDNNGNNLIDGADPICHTDGNATNPNTYDPNLPEVSPSVTQGPNTILSFNILLHGIGNAGDNANPTAHSLSNQEPVRKTRTLDISVFNTNNQLVASGASSVIYASSSGSYKGEITLSSALVPTGNYNVKVGMDQHLTRLLAGIQTITGGQTNTMPDATLITGDINNDNKLDILDYNFILDCYSDLVQAAACADTNKKTASDINDDSFVNQFDYNLFLREISTQPGQ